jgi:hypothetical protein
VSKADELLDADPDHFDQVVTRLIARGDDRAILDLLDQLSPLVAQMRRDATDRFDVAIPILNAASVAAVALRRERPGIFTEAIKALNAVYRLGDVSVNEANDDDVRLFEAVAGALWALGAVIVRKERWGSLPDIVARPPEAGSYYDTWMRHGQVMAARRASDPADDNILIVAANWLRRYPSFGFTNDDREALQRAVAAFDFLAFVHLAHVVPGDYTVLYTSFAKYPTEFIEDYAVRLREEGGDLRTAVFPGSDDELRDVLREANERAASQAAFKRYRTVPWAYLGYREGPTWAFIREGAWIENWGERASRANWG